MGVVGTNWRLYKTSCRLQDVRPRCWEAPDIRKMEEPSRRGITHGPAGWLGDAEGLRAVRRGIPGREGSQEILWACCLSSLESVFPRRCSEAILLLENSSLGHLMFLSSKQEKRPVSLVPHVSFHKGACPAACCLSSPLSTTLLCGVGPVSRWRGFLKPRIYKISRFSYTELSRNTNEIDPRSPGYIFSFCMFKIRSMPLFYLVFTLYFL